MESKDDKLGLDILEVISNGFVDNYTHGLDAKKRLTIPSEWRTLVGQPQRLFIMPSSTERCLDVIPAREMPRVFKHLQEKSLTDEEAQNHIRTLSANANFVPWDAQGRIRIKDNLLDYAQLKSEVVLVGVFTRFELWSPELWKQKQPAIDQQQIKAAGRSVGL